MEGGHESHVERLITESGAPRRRHARQPGEWETVFAELGVPALPTDFRLLADRCQRLSIGTLEVHVPRYEEISFPLGTPPVLNMAEALGWAHESFAESHPLAESGAYRFSDPRGGYLDLPHDGERLRLVPWAAHDSGAVCYWYTEGEPDAWPVVIDFESYAWRYPLTMTGFLVSALTGTVEPGFLVDIPSWW